MNTKDVHADLIAAGLCLLQAIKLVWSAHREIVTDEGPVPTDDSKLTTT